jgi:mRNA interferase YafQ
MLPIRPTAQLKKDLKRAFRQKRYIEKVKKILEILAIPEPLPEVYRDYKLKGVWRDFRECHIEPDWLLIYTITDFELRPTRLGTHDELFNQRSLP